MDLLDINFQFGEFFESESDSNNWTLILGIIAIGVAIIVPWTQRVFYLISLSSTFKIHLEKSKKQLLEIIEKLEKFSNSVQNDPFKAELKNISVGVGESQLMRFNPPELHLALKLFSIENKKRADFINKLYFLSETRKFLIEDYYANNQIVDRYLNEANKRFNNILDKIFDNLKKKFEDDFEIYDQQYYESYFNNYSTKKTDPHDVQLIVEGMLEFKKARSNYWSELFKNNNDLNQLEDNLENAKSRLIKFNGQIIIYTSTLSEVNEYLMSIELQHNWKAYLFS